MSRVDKWTDQLNEKSIIRFGLLSLSTNIVSILFFLLFGVFWGSWTDGLLFWLFFFPLRKNAGGFHAKTQMGCIFFSIVALFLDYYFWEQIIRIKMICVMVSAICCVSIFVLAPQGSRNKELDITEEKVYRKRVCCILSAEVVVFIISIACDWEWGILCVGKSVTMVAVLLGLQKMQSKFWTNN